MSDPASTRPAATVILVRRGGRHTVRGLEVLLVQRNPGARFMPSVWVFPGGAVEADELIGGVAGGETDVDADELAHRAAAIRELGEEAGIDLGPDAELWAWSRWITPEAVPIRFDTRFYVAVAPPHCKPRVDGNEIVDAAWIEPAEALAKHADGEMELVFPTIKHLEALLPYPTADELIEAARDWEVSPVLPRVVEVDGTTRILLPGEEGYELGEDYELR
jgi:8-oxo-dGTP pyrophosphatase MutT (NUDIX family)